MTFNQFYITTFKGKNLSSCPGYFLVPGLSVLQGGTTNKKLNRTEITKLTGLRNLHIVEKIGRNLEERTEEDSHNVVSQEEAHDSVVGIILLWSCSDGPR